jgi:membrane protease subunit (stomatin/prohibitin family)
MKKDNNVAVVMKDGRVVEFSSEFQLNKKLTITVPKGFFAIAYIEGKATIKIQECSNKPVYNSDFGKMYLNKKIKFAYCRIKSLNEINFGFGPVNVNNERLKEAYRVGVNGHIRAEINNFIKLIEYFQVKSIISLEDIREVVLPSIKAIGTQVLSTCFAYSNVSVFEIDSQLIEIRDNITEGLKQEPIFNKLGLLVDMVHVNPIYVNESDLELIRNRING